MRYKVLLSIFIACTLQVPGAELSLASQAEDLTSISSGLIKASSSSRSEKAEQTETEAEGTRPAPVGTRSAEDTDEKDTASAKLEDHPEDWFVRYYPFRSPEDVSGTETESEQDSESSQEGQQGMSEQAEPSGTVPETEDESVSPLDPLPVIGSVRPDKETLPDPSQSGHKLFRTPYIRDENPARLSLYDYRMLREWPLSALPRDLKPLYLTLKDTVKTLPGTWSVYVEDLTTRQALIVGDRAMKSASTMKLFIMAAVYDQMEAGRLDRTEEVVSLLHEMVSNSSNEAANRLLLLLGHDSYAAGIRKVNRYISEHGYSDKTHEYNGFEDASAIVNGSHFNQISAKDIGFLLEKIYSRAILGRKACSEIEDMMLNQGTRYKIPRGLPDGVQVANKTGEMDAVENDCAIVYGQKTDFILVILSEDWDSKDRAQKEIQDIAGEVYAYLNGSGDTEDKEPSSD